MSKVLGTSEEAMPATEHSSKRARQIEPHTHIAYQRTRRCPTGNGSLKATCESATIETSTQPAGAYSAVEETAKSPTQRVRKRGGRIGELGQTMLRCPRLEDRTSSAERANRWFAATSLWNPVCRVSYKAALAWSPARKLSARNDDEGRTKGGRRRARALLSWLRRGEKRSSPRIAGMRGVTDLPLLIRAFFGRCASHGLWRRMK